MSKIFVPNRGLGYVSNHVPLQVRYIKSRKENLVVTCVGRSFHTYGVSHFGLLSVSGLHAEDISCMTSDVYHVYTACDNVIYAWRRGTELMHSYRGHRKSVCLMLPFGAHLISIDDGGGVRVWDIKDESLHLELMFGCDSFKITAVLHPSTYINKVLFGSEQGGLQLWNINTAKLIYTFPGWGAAVSCLQQAPALDVVAVGLTSGRVVLHNLKYDETVMEFTQDWGVVTSISFRSDDHPIMATGSSVGHIVFWDLEERRVASQLLSAHDSAVTGMVCLPNEPLIVTSSPDNTLKLWIFDLTDGGARLLRLREGHSASPTFVRFHGANGHNILSAAGDSTLRIFNTQTEQFNKSLGRASYNRKVSKKKKRAVLDPLVMPPIVQFTSETTREKEWDNVAAAHSGIPMVTVWSYDRLKMGEHKLLPERLHKKNRDLDVDVASTTLSLTHCGNFVIVGYSDGHVDRYNMQSGLWRDSYGNPQAHGSPVRGVSSDGLNQIVVTGGSDSRIKFWPFKSKGGKPLTVIETDEPVHFFRSHRESSMLAVALEDFSVQIVDTDTRTVVRKFVGHTAQITDATFSPNSRWLITAGMDCSVRTWDVPSARLVDQYRTSTACVSLDISPTGEALVTAHVDYLGVFLWCNRTLYQNVSLKALDIADEPALVELPDQSKGAVEERDEEDDEPEFVSPEQIGVNLVTLSGLATSRWQNLLNIDIVRARNKPKAPPKAPKSAPFFLPTLPALTVQFDLNANREDPGSKLLTPQTLLNLTEFGRLLHHERADDDFEPAIAKLKSLGPSMIEFEVKSLAPEGGGSTDVMLRFLKCIEHMLRSNRNFELAQAYLAVFLKAHGNIVADEDELRCYLTNVQTCTAVSWNRIQEALMYNMCVVQNLKTQI